jgi:hypothetical protein
VPQVTPGQVEQHLRLIHATGRTFTYLLNAPGMGGRQFRPDERRRLRNHIDWASAAGIDAVTVSLPDLLELIRADWPHLKVKVSHNAVVRTLPQARMWERLGASMITLHQTAARDFPLLRRLADNLSIPVQLLCTINCLQGCPHSVGYHMSATSTLSSEHAAANRFNRNGSGYCFSWCHLKKATRPEEILKSAFIRPEDLTFYEGHGIREFKLDTRALTTPHVIDRVKAYSLRRYDGDLKRLLSVFSLGYRTGTGRQMGDAAPAAVASEHPAEAAFFSIGRDTDFDRLVFINNRALEGFLEGMPRESCRHACDDACPWCRAEALKAMSWDEPARKRFIETLVAYRRWLLTR